MTAAGARPGPEATRAAPVADRRATPCETAIRLREALTVGDSEALARDWARALMRAALQARRPYC